MFSKIEKGVFQEDIKMSFMRFFRLLTQPIHVPVEL